MTTDTRWKGLARSKQQAILDAIPDKWRIREPIPPAADLRDCTGTYIQQYLTPREIEITESDAVSITQHTTVGLWSAVDVTEAFCHRAAIAHQLVNCLHEIFFDEAIAAAGVLDHYFAQHQKPVGPLHGLPVSLKDQFHVKGVETTMGYVGWIDTFEGVKGDARARTFESELVKELRNLGAVLFCKTSVPTTLMAAETANNIIGYTWNPKNRHLSSGGSSGGEGALIALRGSPAGFGTDIGGSIRVPSAFNGIFGLRPSSGRLPYEGVANSMDGQNIVLSVVGPMATSARSLKLLAKAVLMQSPWKYDPLVHELPWRSSIERAVQELIDGDPCALTFGIMHHDDVVLPQPPVTRAMHLLERMLRRRSHQIVNWRPPPHDICLAIARETFQSDGGEDVRAHLDLSGEPPLPQCLISKSDSLNARQIAALNVRKRQCQKSYLDYWNSTSRLTSSGRPVDAIICPTAPHAAVIPGQFRYVGYTTFVNILDLTSVVIPVTYASKLLDRPEPRDPASFMGREDMEIHSDYDPLIYDGAPVGVQLVGRRLEEEKILCLAEYIHTFCIEPSMSAEKTKVGGCSP
ncbi:amidase signature domain-containing protein [Trichoderma asperelloides]|nr:amidase signature domain-containing protein [Trichoderma asperelloides]